MDCKFYYWDGLPDVGDSMELDSDFSVATLEFGDIEVELRVVGEVCVTFDGEDYYSPSDFPDELMQLIKQGIYGTDKRVYVRNNNWFEGFVYENNVWTGWSDVIEADWKTGGDIFDALLSYAKEYLKEK